MSELERVLAELATFKLQSGHELPVAIDAARLLREMAADFDEYADHGLNDKGENCERAELCGRCGCGLDAARAKWRLS